MQNRLVNWRKRLLRQDYRVLWRHRWLALCAGYQGEPYVHDLTEGVLSVPLDDEGNVICVIEPARTDARPVLALPGGGYKAGLSYADAANTELQEEIGFRADRMDRLGTLNPAVRHAIWLVHLFLARDLQPSRLPGDEGYTITIERVPLADFEELLVWSGRVIDPLTIAALYMTRSFIARESGG
jgi:ADP-ribose diphosphatase